MDNRVEHRQFTTPPGLEPGGSPKGGRSFANPKEMCGYLSPILICALVALVYSPTINFPFLQVDDSAYVFGNFKVKCGLSWESARWAFSALHGGTSYWHPLTWLSHQLDCQLFGLYPGAHRLTNILLHAATSTLVFIVVRHLSIPPFSALLAAAVFAVHPLHVESVVWISERKDLLCGFFYLISLDQYARYRKNGQIAPYVSCLSSGALALMSKPMAVTLPVLLWLLNLHFRSTAEPCRRIPGDLIPPLAGGSAVALTTLLAQHQLGALTPLHVMSLTNRLENIALAYLTYIRRFFWPSDLCVAYGFAEPGYIWSLLAWAFLIGLSAVICVFRHRFPAAFFGWVSFLAVMFPCSGLFQAGPQSCADRYMYVPLLGLTIACLDVMRGLRQYRAIRSLLTTAGLAASLGLTAAACRQVFYWRDGVTLFSRAASMQPDFWFAHLGLGTALASQGRYEEAVNSLRLSVQLNGDASEAYRIIGFCELGVHNPKAALESFRRSFEAKPSAQTVLMLAHLYSGDESPEIGNPQLARFFAEEAIRMSPSLDPKSLLIIASACAAAGEPQLALLHTTRAIEESAKAGDPLLRLKAEERYREYELKRPNVGQ